MKTKQQDYERQLAWNKIRSTYKKNLEGAGPDDESRIKAEYKAAKTRQYRKQFKEDYPIMEAQIELSEELKLMAQNDIKCIIGPFYGAREAYFYKTVGVPKEELDKYYSELIRHFALLFGALTLVSCVAIYDAYKTFLTENKPSVILNLITIGILTYAIKNQSPQFPTRRQPLTLKDYVDGENWETGKPYPNYKNNENERSH